MPTSGLLGRQVTARVEPGHRVLDMGCGAGANAILAAQRTDEVIAVDVNPHAVAATAGNAERNGVGGRVRVFESDVFDQVEGAFDVIVIDPPFRTSGDVAHLDTLIDRAGLASTVIAERKLHVRGELATYFVRRLTA